MTRNREGKRHKDREIERERVREKMCEREKDSE